MAFHRHHHSSSSSSQQQASGDNGTASGMYHAAQTLGSIGTPTGNLRIATGTTGAGTDALFSPGGSTSVPGSGGYAPPSSANRGPGPNPTSIASAPSAASSGQPHQFDVPRKATLHARQPEELHMQPAPLTPGLQNPQQRSPRAQQQQQQQQPAYPQPQLPQGATGAGPPHLNLHQATPSSAAHVKPSSGGAVPGVLQPGGSVRPGPLSMNTAPAAVPTLLQIQTQSQSHMSPSKTASIGHSHGYSRSSPSGGFDSQKYVPYPGTPEAAKFGSPGSAKYTPSQHLHGGISHSPLGLADIRPAGSLSDGTASANPYPFDDESSIPSNSNYLAPWAIYAFDWCKWSVPSHGSGGGGTKGGKIALGSYLEDGHNFIQILDTELVHSSSSEPTSAGTTSQSLEFTKLAEATYTYPVTRILWEPPSSQKQSTDLLATSGDHLRLWSLPANATPITSNSINRSSSVRDPAPYKLTPLALLSNSKSPEHTAPLTSLDWNTLSPSLIITSSIDTTCTIWDIPTLTAKTQLIAHDKEVYDVRFCAASVDVFVSCGADGSVRMFDLRSLEHSTIIYEPSEKLDKGGASPGNLSPTTAQQTMSYAPPLLRLAASPYDSHLLGTFAQDSNIIRILDVRQPGQALLELRGHAASLNSIEWCPSRRGMLASGADDSLVLVWDLLNQSTSSSAQSVNGSLQGPSSAVGPDIARAPAAAWRCEYEVSNISWAPPSLSANQGGDWIGVGGGRGVWGVKI